MTARTRSTLAKTIGVLCLLGVAGVFLFAAGPKIKDPRQFVIAVKNYRILPEPTLHLMALFLPWWELVAALALLVPRMRRAGALLIALMLLMFVVAVSYSALYKGYNINCGCFGKNSAAAGWQTIGLDVGLMIALYLGVRFVPGRASSRAPVLERLGPIGEPAFGAAAE
jgi:uncharacterized membrane protein YphA (DoxX/SURF4 family)